MSHSSLFDKIMREEKLVSYPDNSWPDINSDCFIKTNDITGATISQNIKNCIIIGAGQSGLAIAYGLKREKIDKVILLDSMGENETGPWSTYARMEMLRTPKEQCGFDLGLPSLTFQSWYEAQYGSEAWNKLFRIPRVLWNNYINWYKHVTNPTVLYNTEAIDIEPIEIKKQDIDNAYIYKVTTIDSSKNTDVMFSKTVVIATGASGAGGSIIPDEISSNIPKEIYSDVNHWPIDFNKFTNRTIAIIGAGASAFDVANECLRLKASKAVIYARRKTFPLDNPRRWMEFAGFLDNYPELPDNIKWNYMHHLLDVGQPPPEPTILRSIGYDGFELKLGVEDIKFSHHSNKVRIEYMGHKHDYDFLFSATGYQIDLASRSELKSIIKDVALWSDKFTCSDSVHKSKLSMYPYLGGYSQLQEKIFGNAPWLCNIFLINRASTLSMGPTAASISNIKYTARVIIKGVSRSLFLSGSNLYYQKFIESDHAELKNKTIISFLSKVEIVDHA